VAPRKLPNDILTAERILAMPTGPDKAEVMAFARFLNHHAAPVPDKPGSAICSCGVAARLMPDGNVEAVANPECACPCHEPGYAVGKAR
jgi:hypothetical protein